MEDEEIKYNIIEIDKNFIFSKFSKRKQESNKGDYGRFLNVSGCSEYMGAPVLSSLAAMRCGTGYVILASTKKVCESAGAANLTEAVMLPLEENLNGTISVLEINKIKEKIEKVTAVGLGSGLGATVDVHNIVYDIIRNSGKPIVLDADGLNAVALRMEIFAEKKAPIILTPHLLELSRLAGKSIEEVKKDRINCALEICQKYNVIVIVKDHRTLIVCPDGKIYRNTTGNSGMAKAGSGDVLVGIIGSFLAQGMSAEDSALCGVYIHGLAGDYAAKKFSEYFMLPRDIITSLSDVFKEIEKYQ